MLHSEQAVICGLLELQARCSDILFEVFDRRRSRNRKDHLGTLEYALQANLGCEVMLISNVRWSGFHVVYVSATGVLDCMLRASHPGPG
jgi:hypothetical protein